MIGGLIGTVLSSDTAGALSPPGATPLAGPTGSAGSVWAGGSGSGSTGFEIVGGLIFEIGGSTERVSVVAAGSLFLGRFSSISETVSGFWGSFGGAAGA